MIRKIENILEGLKKFDYLADETIANVIYLAKELKKPILIEGPAGVGKTDLSKAVSGWLKSDLIRLQCYEGLDETKALYEWNYKKQLLRIQADQSKNLTWDEMEEDLFSEKFLLPRPLLSAITLDKPTVLLIDEIDKVDLEFEGLLLEILSDFQVSIPELGTIKAKRIPFVVLTSNNTRELSEALRRRCLYLYLDFPLPEREKQIILLRIPDLSETIAEQIVKVVQKIRQMELSKAPSISETLDWARTLLILGIKELNQEIFQATLNVLLKNHKDSEKVKEQFHYFYRPIMKPD